MGTLTQGTRSVLQVWARAEADSVWHAFSHQEGFQRINGNGINADGLVN